MYYVSRHVLCIVSWGMYHVLIHLLCNMSWGIDNVSRHVRFLAACTLCNVLRYVPCIETCTMYHVLGYVPCIEACTMCNALRYVLCVRGSSSLAEWLKLTYLVLTCRKTHPHPWSQKTHYKGKFCIFDNLYIGINLIVRLLLVLFNHLKK